MKTNYARWLLVGALHAAALAYAQAPIGDVQLDYGLNKITRFRIGDADVHYLDVGSGEPVVLIHGAGCDYRYWQPVVEAISGEYRAILISSRHHFPSVPGADLSDYTLANHVSDVIAVIDALDIAPVHLVGHSQGGNIAALLALQRPDLVRTLILEEGAFVEDASADAQSERQRASETVRDIPALFAAGDTDAVNRLFADLVDGEGTYANAPRSAQQFWLDNLHTLNTPHEVSSTPLDCRALERIVAPTLLIRGDITVKFLKLYLDSTEACLRDAETVLISNAAHNVHHGNPVEFNRALLAFLRSN